MDFRGDHGRRWRSRPAARWDRTGIRLRRTLVTAIVALTATLGPALPLGAQGADPPVLPTDGGSQARWVVGELALLVVGSICGRLWVVRRSRRRHRDGHDASAGAAGEPPGSARPTRPGRTGRRDHAVAVGPDPGRGRAQHLIRL